jgi:hypothetical protein
MPSPDQLQQLQNPEIMEAFLKDFKTSEIQSKLDAIGVEGFKCGTFKTDAENGITPEIRARMDRDRAMAELAKAREGATY